MRIPPACLALALAAAPLLAGAQSYDYKEGYRKGYDDGFASGYRKGLEESRRAPPPPAYVPPPAAVPALGPIRVTRALYGNASRSCDATRYVARQANGRTSASVNVSNQMCGDPTPGERKELEVTYVCGAFTKTASAYEHRTVYLDCTTPN